MNKLLELYGPLIFWTLMFLTGTIIKIFGFDDNSFWIEIPTDISLWATGVLFTLSTSEKTYYNAKLKPKYEKMDDGKGFSVEFEVTVDDEFGFKPKFLYLFLVGMTIWIINLILSEVIPGLLQLQNITFKLIVAIIVTYLLGGLITVIALYSTYEVTK